jgi:spore coat polysaccharide biosynthesis protein SpsF (cytidylyltransferase family)
VEVFNRKILNFINTNAIDSSGTEYLTYYIKDNEDFFRTGSAPVLKKHQKKIRLTIDNKKDFKFVKPFLEDMIKKRKIDDFNIDDILSFYKSRTNKQIAKQKNFSINTGLKKNSYKKLLT